MPYPDKQGYLYEAAHGGVVNSPRYMSDPIYAQQDADQMMQAIVQAILAAGGQAPGQAQPKPQALQGINGLLGPGMSANPPPMPPRALVGVPSK